MAEIPHIEKPVTDYAKQRGFFVRKCSWIGRRKAPDRLFFGKGRHFFIEFKDTGEEPDDGQAKEIKRMRDNGITVHVIDNVEAGKKLFD